MGESMISESNERSLIRYNHITYLLYAISFFTAGLLWIVPIVMNYLRRRDAEGTWLATHFDWQIKTFWYSIVFVVIGTVLIIIGVGGLGLGLSFEHSGMSIGSSAMAMFGAFLILASIIWHLYRIVKGWIALADNRPV